MACLNAIRRVVAEYHDALQKGVGSDAAEQMKRQRDIERIVAQYNELNKALKRLRRKLQPDH